MGNWGHEGDTSIKTLQQVEKLPPCVMAGGGHLFYSLSEPRGRSLLLWKKMTRANWDKDTFVTSTHLTEWKAYRPSNNSRVVTIILYLWLGIHQCGHLELATQGN